MAVGDSLTVTPVDTGTATSTVSDTDSADSGANGTEPTDKPMRRQIGAELPDRTDRRPAR